MITAIFSKGLCDFPKKAQFTPPHNLCVSVNFACILTKTRSNLNYLLQSNFIPEISTLLQGSCSSATENCKVTLISPKSDSPKSNPFYSLHCILFQDQLSAWASSGSWKYTQCPWTFTSFSKTVITFAKKNPIYLLQCILFQDLLSTKDLALHLYACMSLFPIGSWSCHQQLCLEIHCVWCLTEMQSCWQLCLECKKR